MVHGRIDGFVGRHQPSDKGLHQAELIPGTGLVATDRGRRASHALAGDYCPRAGRAPGWQLHLHFRGQKQPGRVFHMVWRGAHPYANGFADGSANDQRLTAAIDAYAGSRRPNPGRCCLRLGGATRRLSGSQLLKEWVAASFVADASGWPMT